MEPNEITAEQVFDRFADRGAALEKLGKAMQNPDSTIEQLVAAAFEGGWGLELSFPELFPR